MKWFTGYDHYCMSEDLDLASWDWYVGTGHNDYTSSGVLHDLVRGYKQQNFWLIETQPGSVNWKEINNSLNKGETRAIAWHAVAHGADAVLYWQWRSALGGQEQMHGTLVDQSGRPRPFYEEARQIGQDFAVASGFLAGSRVKASVAMLNDYDSLWALQWQPHHRDFDYVEHFTHYYRPLAALNVAVDVVSARGLGKEQNLTGYKLVIAPALLLQNKEMVAALRNYVSQGGHLVLTVRSGMKDEYNALLPLRQPGELAEIAGIEVEEYYALDEPVPVGGKLFSGESRLWAERLTPIGDEKARTIAQYGKSNGWLDGHIAISVHSFEKGLVYYVGAYLDETSQKTLLARMLKTAAVTTITAPPGFEISTRVRPDGEVVYIVINHKAAENTIHLPWDVFNHLTGEKLPRELNFTPYGVAVVTQLKG
jgi:beta-galactosidase